MVPALLLCGQARSSVLSWCVYNPAMTFIEQLSEAQLGLAQALGIDVYRLRRSQPLIAEPQEADSKKPASTSTAVPDASLRAHKASGARGELAAMREVLGVEPSLSPEVRQPAPSAPPTPSVSESSAPADDAAEAVQCELTAWRSERVFLVCAGGMLNDDSQRLIQDLLRALDPGKRPTRMQFSWPAGGGGPTDAQSAGKAWRAFWQRRSDGAALLLATTDSLLEQWLSGVEGVHWLPAVDALVGNGEGKRALWQALATHDANRVGKGQPIG